MEPSLSQPPVDTICSIIMAVAAIVAAVAAIWALPKKVENKVGAMKIVAAIIAFGSICMGWFFSRYPDHYGSMAFFSMLALVLQAGLFATSPPKERNGSIIVFVIFSVSSLSMPLVYMDRELARQTTSWISRLEKDNLEVSQQLVEVVKIQKEMATILAELSQGKNKAK